MITLLQIFDHVALNMLINNISSAHDINNLLLRPSAASGM